MQDSICHMTLNWHFIRHFEIKHDLSAISKCDMLRMTQHNVICVICISNPLVGYEILCVAL